MKSNHQFEADSNQEWIPPHLQGAKVKSTALILRMTKSDFQRKAILSFCKNTLSEHGFDK